MIPFLDLKAATEELREQLDGAYNRFMDSGLYVLGEEVARFELEYAQYCRAEHCVGVGTGLDALTLALRALDVGPGDEVIVPSNTYIATWLAVTQVGATIVPVEPDLRTFNLDPALVQHAMSQRTRVILAVNLYGQPVDYDSLRDIANEGRAKLVIDNAQAHGARYKNRVVGGIADIECHSFYPSKNLGALGEAGAVTTNDATIADRIRLLRNYGSRIRYYNEECGTNSRLDALQAAFLRVKLRYLDEWNDRRKIIANIYQQNIGQSADVILPFVPEWADPVWHLYVIRCNARDELRKLLESNGIGTQIHYPVPPAMSKAYEDLEFTGDLNVSESLAKQILSLPIGPHLKIADVNFIVTNLQRFINLV